MQSPRRPHYKLRHGEEGRRFGAPFPEAVVTRGRVAKPFLFDSISLLLHPFLFETRRFTPCRFRIAMGGRVLHERNAGGVFVCEAGASHPPMAHHFVRPSPAALRWKGDRGEGAETVQTPLRFPPTIELLTFLAILHSFFLDRRSPQSLDS